MPPHSKPFKVPDGLFGPALSRDIPDPATDAEVRRTESALGVRLPAEFIAILQFRNGGSIKLTSFRLAGAAAKKQGRKTYGFTRIAGVHPTHTDGLKQLTTLAREEWELPDGLIPLDGDGHRWCCLDYRACGPAGEPSVTHIDTEGGGEFQVAESFATFIRGLFRDDESLTPALIALDDGAPLGDHLAAALAGLGCTKHDYPGVFANPRFPLPPTWHWPKFRGILKNSPVWIKFEHNKLYITSLQKTPGRPAEHPMLTVAVSPDDAEPCLKQLLAAIGSHATLIHGVQ